MPAFDVRAAFSEFLAMTLFVYIGCGAVPTGNVLAIALAFGLAITVLAYATAHTSGGQINCAVTLALVIVGEVPLIQGVANFFAQLVGGILGATLLWLTNSRIFGTDPKLGGRNFELGSNGIQGRNGWEPITDMHPYSVMNAFLVEFMMTFVLVYVVMETAVNKNSVAKNNAPIAIGLAVFLAHIVCIPISGCGINPTRSFGPALIAGQWDHHWIYWVAPLLGATVAALLAKFVLKSTGGGAATAGGGNRDDNQKINVGPVP
jgi:MIP family channel proteins